MRRHVVERHGVARAAAAAFLRRIERRDLRRRIGQRLRRQQIAAAAAGPLDVSRAPDLRRPVGRTAALVEIDMQGHQHGGADRLEAELFLAAPLQSDPAIRNAHGDQGRVEGRIVGAVVAIAARAMQVLRRDRLDRQAEHRSEVLAQRMHALAVRAHRQVTVAELGQGARRRHRGVRDVGPRDGDLHRVVWVVSRAPASAPMRRSSLG